MSERKVECIECKVYKPCAGDPPRCEACLTRIAEKRVDALNKSFTDTYKKAYEEVFIRGLAKFD